MLNNLSNQENTNKTTLKFYFTPVRVAKINNNTSDIFCW